jgi:hypothetical protein
MGLFHRIRPTLLREFFSRTIHCHRQVEVRRGRQAEAAVNAAWADEIKKKG